VRTYEDAEGRVCFDIVLRRRPEPAAPPPLFVCVICQTEIRPPRHFQREGEKDRAPICNSCAEHWAAHRFRPFGLTRGDKRRTQRLSAITQALNWEVHNGKRAQ
jgi:hypothetical protein